MKNAGTDKDPRAPLLFLPIVKSIGIIVVFLLAVSLIAFVLEAPVQVPEPAINRQGADQPVDIPALEQGTKMIDPLDPERDYTTFVNSLSIDDLQKSITDGDKGLIFDLSAVDHLLDGRHLDPAKANGKIYIGPYPYQAKDTKYRYKRFLSEADVAAGKALIPAENFLDRSHNTEGWTDRGAIVVRVILAYNNTLIGGYDTIVGFVKDEKGFHKVPWLVEGPFVNRIDSRRAEYATISFAASEPVSAVLTLSDGRSVVSPAQKYHEILLNNLTPGNEYTYQVTMSDITTPDFTFRAAPPVSDTAVVFAAAGDSRQGYGGFLNNFMGMNYATLDMISASAFENKAEFFVIPGDLVDGYTMVAGDFTTQLNAFKQCMAGFWSERPVYTTMGNHELIYDIYKMPPKGNATTKLLVKIDRMPYGTESSEALYAGAFTNPLDAPAPSDPRRPTYNESVYTVQYGSVRLIALNNDYWTTIDTDFRNPETKQFGGAPYGYMMEDQLAWAEQELQKAESDPSVKYVFVLCHCGLFPTFADAPMWRYGNDNTRAYTFTNGTVVPEKMGLVTERNRLAMAIGNSSKVAAVINSHEHLYSRILMTNSVPAGIPSKDDKNGDGMITPDEPKSPLPLRYPTWYLVTGCAGGPSYAPVDPSPWTQYWQGRPDPSAGFALSLQEHYMIISTDNSKVSVKVVNLYGETIDKVDDLMAVKRA